MSAEDYCPGCNCSYEECECAEVWCPPAPAPAESKADNKQVGGTHYKAMKVEPWNVVDSWPLEQRIGYYRGGALKYLMRMGSKDESAQEIAKGQHYMQKLLEVLKEGDSQRRSVKP